MNKREQDAIAHTEKATDLLRQAKAIHDAEASGQISNDEALPIELQLIDEANAESDAAIAGMKEILSARPD